VFRGCSDYVIRKNHVTRPIFEVSRLQNPEISEFVENSNFHPITKEKLNLDFKIRIAQGHFWKIYKAR